MRKQHCKHPHMHLECGVLTLRVQSLYVWRYSYGLGQVLLIEVLGPRGYSSHFDLSSPEATTEVAASFGRWESRFTRPWRCWTPSCCQGIVPLNPLSLSLCTLDRMLQPATCSTGPVCSLRTHPQLLGVRLLHPKSALSSGWALNAQTCPGSLRLQDIAIWATLKEFV